MDKLKMLYEILRRDLQEAKSDMEGISDDSTDPLIAQAYGEHRGKVEYLQYLVSLMDNDGEDIDIIYYEYFWIIKWIRK